MKTLDYVLLRSFSTTAVYILLSNTAAAATSAAVAATLTVSACQEVPALEISPFLGLVEVQMARTDTNSTHTPYCGRGMGISKGNKTIYRNCS